MQTEVTLTNEEKSLLLDILFRQNYATEILAVELADIEIGLKKADISQYRRITRLFNRLKNEGY
ncbi:MULTISPECIES: antirepressor AbbA [Bacillus]|uniref:antirepressor AbbA n=1 Tax=Bacillus TaxID=1386 RepID=UPI0003654CFE|nr:MULTISPECIES: antirepressor AbbA [Bacillus]PEP62414.1 recombinase XerD [Bacillus pseudomycoides]PGS09272.1 recombinase XerD [Bacillus pseudomycoides]PHC95276.1 recombinase XerD [Bacillus pseudomycoides]